MADRHTDPVIERLESWGCWLQLGANPHRNSSLTIVPNSGALRAYIPVNGADCERTHAAVMCQPQQLREVATGLYVEGMSRAALAKRLEVSPQHISRLHELLRKRVQLSIKNQMVRTVPMRTTWKTGAT